MQNYFLIVEYEKEEVATLKAPLKDIDKFTTIFKSENELLNHLFDDDRLMFEYNLARIKVKTPKGFYIDPYYSQFNSVIVDQENIDYEEFINGIIPMPLFRILNDFYNELVSKYTDIERKKLEKLNDNKVYLWDNLFSQKLSMSFMQEQEKNEYIYLKGTVDNLHLNKDLISSLNSLIKLIDIKEDLEKRQNKKDELLKMASKETNEEIKEKKIIEINEDKTLSEYSFETQTIEELKEKTRESMKNYNKNYRDFRDLYGKLSIFFQTKEEKTKRAAEAYKQDDRFVRKTLDDLKNQLVDKMFEDASNDVNLAPAPDLYSDIEDSYKEKLEADLIRAQNNNDEELEEKIREELSKYLAESESMKL